MNFKRMFPETIKSRSLLFAGVMTLVNCLFFVTCFTKIIPDKTILFWCIASAITIFLFFTNILITYFWLKSLLKPIYRLKEAIKITVSGSFYLPVPDKQRKDELGELYESFYMMIKTLENHCVELEKKISKRTLEIEAIHNQLIQAGKLAAVGEMAAGVAHELNNPIGGILGYSQFMLEKLQDAAGKGDAASKTFAHYMEFITRESQRCKRVIQNLLKFSRTSNMEMSKVDINVVLADTVEIVQHQIRLEQVEFVSKFHPQLPMINGDAIQLQQVFLNLLLNAIKSISTPSEAQILIASHPVKINGVLHAEIRIADNGCGIPLDQQDKIFYPFYTTRKTGEGTGLGLSLSYGIIKEHGGSITFESEVGKGTTFIISIPGVS